MGKLANETSPKNMPIVLTNHRDVQFELSLKYPLENGYTFRTLGQRNIKEFQGFLDKVTKMTVQQVDKVFARPTDKNDFYNKKQVLHYEVNKSFRVHTILEDGRYVIIRIDPNHKKHK